MSKKKKNDGEKYFKQMMDSLTEMMSNMSDEELNRMNDVLTGKVDSNEIINKSYYRYQRPDYSKTARLPMWLAPFWNTEHDDNKVSLCGFVDEDGQHLSLEQKKEDLRSYLYLLFDNFTPVDKGHQNEWRLFGPLWLMEKYKMTDCLDVVLEVLRQDSHFITTYIEGLNDYLSAILYQLGNDQLDMLKDMLYETGLIPLIKPIVFDALIWTAIRQPQKRLRVVYIITQYLSHCLEICKQGANPMNIESYAFSLATAHIQETMPMIRRLYTEIDFGFAIKLDEIEDYMNNDLIEFHCAYDNLDAYLRELRYSYSPNLS